MSPTTVPGCAATSPQAAQSRTDRRRVRRRKLHQNPHLARHVPNVRLWQVCLPVLAFANDGIVTHTSGPLV
jgi:hypothetical protein